MKLNKPILVGWQKTPQADFIRRHPGLFKPRSKESALFTPGLFFFVVLPFTCLSILTSNRSSDWVLFSIIIGLFASGGLYIVLVQAASEERNDDQ